MDRHAAFPVRVPVTVHGYLADSRLAHESGHLQLHPAHALRSVHLTGETTVGAHGAAVLPDTPEREEAALQR